MRLALGSGVFLLVLSWAGITPAAVQYSVTDLGVLPGGDVSAAYAINDGGEIVGCSSIVPGGATTGRVYAFRGGVGGIEEVGPGILVPLAPNYYASAAYAINRYGVAAGFIEYTYRRAGIFYPHPPPPPYELPDFSTISAGISATATGINDSGVVVGMYTTDWFWQDVHAFVYAGGVFLDLGTLGGFHPNSWANDINNSGHVVGAVDSGYWTPSRAFVWSDATGMQTLGTLRTDGSGSSEAFAINDADVVVGKSDTNVNQSHAFVYSGGLMTDLGSLGGNSVAYSINASGVVVGSSYTSGNREHAFVYSDGVMTDLNDLLPAGSQWELTAARGINAGGSIVGYGISPSGYQHAFLLQPLGGTDGGDGGTVPEPSTLAMFLGLGGMGLIAACRRRKRAA